ncbi:MAG: hypothetical protein ASARMPREDX12_007896 [Alectoria sarmentosa]|nr:MAG: hypothetical protein ASARMPREDX12_007896 [Alectoria sarmentosa]
MELWTLLKLLSAFFVLYVIGLYVYRMYFDPLSKIPGPKLAAASLWYEFYYDVVKKGRYTWKIWEMHDRYGPIVRISPYEIHINDPEMIDEVYPNQQKRSMKYGWAMKMLGLKTGALATESHELHRIRRGIFAHYLSKATLLRLEPGIQSVIDKLVSRLEGLKGSGRNVNLLDVYASLTGDIIGQYAFAQPYGFLDDPDFSPYWHKLIMGVSQNGHILKQFGWMMPLMKAMPTWLVKIIQPQMMTLIEFQQGFRRQVIQAKEEIARGEKPIGQETIFYDVLTNDQVRPQEKETDHLQDEAQTIIAAGTVTTGHILAIVSFYLVSNLPVLGKLQTEIENLMSKTGPSPKWQQLEQLPYLTAVITESLRIGYGVSHRLQRLFPDTVFQYNGYALPPMTPTLAHLDQSAF